MLTEVAAVSDVDCCRVKIVLSTDGSDDEIVEEASKTDESRPDDAVDVSSPELLAGESESAGLV